MFIKPMLTTGWFISIYLVLLQYTIPLVQAQEGTSSISGYAFFDSSSDGIKDPTNTLDYGIYDISVWLFNCQDEILKTTKTNTAGYYSFDGIDSMSLDTEPFGYYIYASVPKWYVVTETWNGAQDPSSGELLYPNVDSSVNPSTGRTNCFEVDDGDNAEVDFGLNFYVEPTPPDTPQRPPAVEPTPATRPPLTSTTAPTAAKVTSNPTNQPIVVAPATRPPIQAVTARPTNKPTIPSVVIPATPPPVLSLKPSPSPTKETSKPTTASPINSPSTTTSKPTSSSPTKIPTIRIGTTITNSTLKQLSMTIAGITSIEDTNTWSEITKLHIECYFNGCNTDMHGVWDVSVDLNVVDVVSSTEQKKVRSLPWIDQQDDETKGLTRRRKLQETTYVQVIYNQVSTYTTSDPILYDDLYVATNPFTQETSQDAYIASLKAADSSVYDDVTSIISVRQLPSQGSSVPVLGGDVPPPTPPANTDSVETDNNSNSNNEGDDGGSNNTAIIIAVVVCLVIVIVASAVIVKYRRMSQQNAYSGEPVGNGPKSSMRQFDSGNGNGDLEHGNGNGDSGTYSNGFGSSSSFSRRSSSSKFPGMTTFDESAFEHLTSSQGGNGGSSHSEKMIQIIAPPGKLGVVVDTPPSGGCAYVCEIKNTCPIRNEIQLEDRIIAVDRDDVQKMSAVDVSKLLAKRSRNEERKITVLRRVKGPSDSAASSSQPKGGSMFGSVADSLSSSAAAPQASPISSSSKDKEVLMDVTAPAGKLGVVLVTPEPPETGPAYVFKIRDDSPLVNKLLLGDKVLAVDDEDVRGMTAINVSKLLGSKSGQESRKISIKRVVDISAGGGVEVTPNDTTPAPTTSSGGFDINTPGEIFEIIAPPGKLGIVVDSPPEGGCAFVSDIKQECPIKTRIKLGDKLIKVDDEDVSTLKAVHVSMLLGSKSRNDERKLTVLRDT